MAYEVTKRIGARAYRYRVESVRDPESGRRRNRWTYLGRAEGGSAVPAEPRRRSDARVRLLDALDRLLAQREFGGITADAVAAEAGLAHGTFYRHFGDKREALLASLARVRESRAPMLDALRDDVADVEEARAGLRRVVEGLLRTQATFPGLLRAFYTLALRDDELARQRRERKLDASRRIAEHLRALTRRGLARVDDPDATAYALFAMLDGFHRDAVVDGVPLDEARIAGAVGVAERAVFGRIARRGAR